MSPKSAFTPLLFLLFLGTSWGLYFSLLKIAVLSGISYVGITTLTTLGACIGMFAIAIYRKRLPTLSWAHIVFYCVCAVLGYLLPMVAELFVIAHMPAGVLTLIVSMAPLATLLFAAMMKTDRIDVRRTAGMLIGAFAVFAILLPDAHLNESIDWHWLLLATLAPLSYALYHNYIARYWPAGSDSYQVAAGEALLASILILGFSMFNWQWQDVQSWNQGHSVIVFMSLISLIDIYIYFELIRLRGPIYTSHANYFMVVSGVFWGVVLFSEKPSSLMWLSAILLSLSLYLISGGRSRGVEQAQ